MACPRGIGRRVSTGTHLYILLPPQRREQDPPPLPPTEYEEPRPPPLRTDARQRGSRAGDCGGSYALPRQGPIPRPGRAAPARGAGDATRVGWARGDHGRTAAVRGRGRGLAPRGAPPRVGARAWKWAEGPGRGAAGGQTTPRRWWRREVWRPRGGTRRRGRWARGDSLAAGAQRRRRLRRRRGTRSARRYRRRCRCHPVAASRLPRGWRRAADGPWAKPAAPPRRAPLPRAGARVRAAGGVPACPAAGRHRGAGGLPTAGVGHPCGADLGKRPAGKEGVGCGWWWSGVGATRWGLRVAFRVGRCASGVDPPPRTATASRQLWQGRRCASALRHPAIGGGSGAPARGRCRRRRQLPRLRRPPPIPHHWFASHMGSGGGSPASHGRPLGTPPSPFSPHSYGLAAADRARARTPVRPATGP